MSAYADSIARQERAKAYAAQAHDPIICPKCDGNLDTGFECLGCGYDAAPVTQPATSQEGEDGISDAQINDAIRHGFGDRFADDDQRDRVLAALNNLRVNPSVDEIPLVLSEIIAILQPDVLRDRIAVLERENGNYAKTMDIIGQLPATPTPPTLSEEDEAEHKLIIDWIDGAIARAKKHGGTEGIWLFGSQWHTVRAALARAQVKAS